MKTITGKIQGKSEYNEQIFLMSFTKYKQIKEYKKRSYHVLAEYSHMVLPWRESSHEVKWEAGFFFFFFFSCVVCVCVCLVVVGGGVSLDTFL